MTLSTALLIGLAIGLFALGLPLIVYELWMRHSFRRGQQREIEWRIRHGKEDRNI